MDDLDATGLEDVASESKSPRVAALKEQLDEAKFDLAKVPHDDVANPAFKEATARYDAAVQALKRELVPLAEGATGATGNAATGETGNNNYVNVDAPTGSVNHANNIVVHNSATYRVLKPSVLPYTPTGAEASADGVVVDATGAMIAKKHWTRLVGELREAEDKLGDLSEARPQQRNRLRGAIGRDLEG